MKGFKGIQHAPMAAPAPISKTALGRRRFLSGLLTLAVIPSRHTGTTGLTPLETAVEDVRRAYLRHMLYGQRGIKPLVQAMQRHRALGLPGRERVLTLRLAFRLARRDYRLLCPVQDGLEPRPSPILELHALAAQRVRQMMEQLA